MIPGGPKWGPRGFFIYRDLADILGDTDLNCEFFSFFCFLIFGAPSLGPAWAQLGPSLDPAWARLWPSRLARLHACRAWLGAAGQAFRSQIYCKKSTRPLSHTCNAPLHAGIEYVAMTFADIVYIYIYIYCSLHTQIRICCTQPGPRGWSARVLT